MLGFVARTALNYFLCLVFIVQFSSVQFLLPFLNEKLSKLMYFGIYKKFSNNFEIPLNTESHKKS